MKIGHVIRRLRHAQGKTLQQLCDATGGQIHTGYLSKIERDQMTPNVHLAASIARSLGVTVDDILSMAEGDHSFSLPVERRRLVPVVAWSDYHTLEYGYQPGVSKPQRWVSPPHTMSEYAFALDVTDTSMQTTDSFSFGALGVILVEPDRRPKHSEYVVAFSKAASKALFRRYITDGVEDFFSALNPQFPMRKFTDEWSITGVVTGYVLDISPDG
jgi:transcriptional regulator with XRE-family HTH domain